MVRANLQRYGFRQRNERVRNRAKSEGLSEPTPVQRHTQTQELGPDTLLTKGRTVEKLKEEDRVDHDQIYLAERIGERWEKNLTIPALQRLNLRFGRAVVTSALRSVHGFPPQQVRDPYAYLLGVCRAVSA